MSKNHNGVVVGHVISPRRPEGCGYLSVLPLTSLRISVRMLVQKLQTKKYHYWICIVSMRFSSILRPAEGVINGPHMQSLVQGVPGVVA